MTILVSVKIHDGIVMAADSASSFAGGMVYYHARKIRNIADGIPVGVMVAGSGGIGNESIDTLLKDLQVRLCGYSAGASLAEVWDVFLDSTDALPPRCAQGPSDFGPRWAGEGEALDRLVLGLPGQVGELLARAVALGPNDTRDLRARLAPDLYELLFLEAMPLRDAAALARFLVEATIGFVRFSVTRPKTVGGPIEMAAITKHEGFHWLEHD